VGENSTEKKRILKNYKKGKGGTGGALGHGKNKGEKASRLREKIRR